MTARFRFQATRSLAVTSAAVSLSLALGLVAAATPAAAAPAAASGSSAPSADPQDISGVWQASAYPRALRPMDGGALPFTDAGRKAYETTVAGLKSGAIVDETRHHCLPAGTPRAMQTPYPLLIVQSPGEVDIALEQNRVYRVVRLTDKHADTEEWDPSFMGEAIGHWEGPSLVIDTTNFKPKTFIDDSGLPHSDKLHVVERLRKIDGGRKLQDQITVDDPEMFTRPWTSEMVYDWRPDVRLRTDWVCGMPHRDVSGVKVEGRAD